MAERWELVAFFLVVGVGACLWAWRYWALRTWRTLALLLGAALLGALATSWSQYGAFIGPPILGIALWLVASAQPLVMSISEEDYLYAENLREADEEARRILTSRPNASPEAIGSLDRVIAGLLVRPPHPEWEPARAAKIEELSLARSTLVDTDTSSETADALRQRRADARRLFFDARRARSGFWATPE